MNILKIFDEDKNENENENENNSESNIINSNTYLENFYNFKHPIEYLDDVKTLDPNIIETLELINPIDKNNSSIYETIFQTNNNDIAKLEINKSTKFYTTDIEYLKQTQKLLKRIDIDKENLINSCNDSLDALNSYEEIKRETGFYEKYLYLNFDSVKFLNENPLFLQIMSLYNIISPILSLCIPIFVLILPFIIIKIRGLEINLNQYMLIINQLISNHAITKIFTDFNNVDIGEKIYIVLSAFFYCFSIYQNIITCVRFYQNIMRIHDYLNKMKLYISNTLNKMKYYLSISMDLKKYNIFNTDLNKNFDILNNFFDKLNNITDFKISISKIFEMGEIMEIFYKIYENKIINEALLYSFGFNGYFYNLLQIKNNINNKNMSYAKYLKKNELKENELKEQKSKTPFIENIYYPKFINESKCIKNSCTLDKNIILTGPNASGKTTFIKSIFINILLSQQFGVGCYDKLEFIPYDNFHCYLNIPDTSGRDSLFQAEARRCKNIIDSINENDHNDTHLCIFDELYSGTNPDEAIVSAEAFMKYITSLNNTFCLLTTHYIKLCKKMKENKNIINYNMKTITDEKSGNFKYTYKLKSGISKIKGGIQILKDMNYPDYIINNIF